MPFYVTPELLNLLSKLVTPHPTERSSLEAIMPDSWLNMGQEEELWPYNEPPSDGMDPWVTQQMVNVGFHLDQIENTLSGMTYNNVMGMHQILK